MDYIIGKSLTKTFNNHTVLSNVNINIEKGSLCGFIGRNGSGKTILFKIICGMMRPSSGEVFIDSKKIGTDDDFYNDMGIIIETPGFLYEYTGFQNLKLLSMLRGKIDKSRIVKSMEMVGLAPYEKKHVSKYSLGMRQRLGLAQAIMESPSLLVLDEPMNGLDRAGVQDIRKLLLELKHEGCTILLSSHNKEDIETLCEKVYEIDAAKLTEIF